MFKTFEIVGLNLKKLILESLDARNCSCNSSKSPDFSSRSSIAIDSKKELECSFGMENPLPSESLINDLCLVFTETLVSVSTIKKYSGIKKILLLSLLSSF